MMELIKRSEEDRKICTVLEPYMPDEYAARGCSYHIQQAIEKQMKALLLAYGIDYPRVHNIQTLLNKIRENDIQLDENLLNDIEDLSDTLTAWEAMSRYDADQSFTERKYNKAKNLYDNLKSVLDQIVQMYLTNEETEDYSEEDTIITPNSAEGRK